MTSLAASVEAAYDYCQEITRREARNFYFAFLTLPRAKRRAIYAAYAFARAADDAADSPASAADRARGVAALRGELRQAFAGAPRGPVLVALADASRAYGIDPALYEELLDGVEMDLAPRRYETFDDLRAYCYRVASVVGLISIEIFGYDDPRARDAAVDLGIAMQLTNIIRDVGEDAALGRVYLPQEELRRYGCPEDDLMRGATSDAYVALMRFQARRAREFFVSGRGLLPYLDPRSRSCPAALADIYSRLLDRIERRRFDVFGERVRLSAPEKLGIMARRWAEGAAHSIRERRA